MKSDGARFWGCFAPSDDPRRIKTRVLGFRVLAAATIVLAFNYIIWRYTKSLNLNALWFAIPMVVAETYGIIESFLFIFMIWKPASRRTPTALATGSVDVFIVTYDEPVELLRMTAEAAMNIRWRDKSVFILDDGNRPAMARLADELGCSYITRGSEWESKPRHAKAGNINNALLQTSGEYILILDADQIPAPLIVEHTIGYFSDPEIAFVQTPQYFYNIPPGDPFGSDAPLFYGPIQQGKDGRNAAFFCGSNALLRREALLQLGLTGFVQEMEEQMEEGIARLRKSVRKINTSTKSQKEARAILKEGLKRAEQLIKTGSPLEHASDQVRKALRDAEKVMTASDVGEIALMLREMAEQGDQAAMEAYTQLIASQEDLFTSTEEEQPGARMGFSVSDLESINLTRSEEAIPIQSLVTISVTEDMATAMRLHSLGWKSIFHSEILAYGLAPEDLESSLKQRLRWAQGTIQVFFKENPFRIKGLSFTQRLMYFATMYSYFSGFFTIILLLAPAVYLFTAIPPVTSWSWEFLAHLLPFFILNKLLFRYLSWGIPVHRGEQYNLGLFPIFIKATLTALFKKNLSFIVTPKNRQRRHGGLNLVIPQLGVILVTAMAMVYGTFSYVNGSALTIGGLLINCGWGLYNIYMLSAIVYAAVYKAPEGWEAHPPASLFPGDYNKHKE
ncbi:glycosyltransferase family 2 protein [Sediminispirochaeta bajacaliforniensis]|uniref:glycosyltransferase family 2 protein n=1 Tax=Sediminispirochaeta bajacaliforniensis TaxID=148 RepID=UPI0003689011|nr:glycosyltransferase family 2 protein [Sediminispirochaeta bajacaliforniensis]